jgi:hypothetical protein
MNRAPAHFHGLRKLSLAIMIAATSIVVTTAANAGPIVTGAKVTKVLNTRGPHDASFIVWTEGGTGPCANSYIYFYPTGGSNPEMQKRAYSAALIAMTTGLRVDIESHPDNNCQNAYFINVYQ